jgi:hypothetical protein
MPRTTKHVVKYPHCPERELTYIVIPACVPNTLDLRAIHFKFHDRLNHCPIGFQNMTPRTTQNDECFCAYRCSVKLHPINIVSPVDVRGLLPNAHTTNESIRFQHKEVRGS